MVEWWKGAAATISGVAFFGWSVHYWNEGYRQRGETHPITAWLEQHVSREEDDRRRRIEALEREARRAERRLTAIHRWLPHLQSRAHEITREPDSMHRRAAIGSLTVETTSTATTVPTNQGTIK